MAVIAQLGINWTVGVQFLLFIITIFVLIRVAFRPYFEAYLQREEQTKGGESLALELIQDAQGLRNEYEQKARQVNMEIKSIFDGYRGEATQEQEAILSKARKDATHLVEETRAQISSQMTSATKKIHEEAPLVAQAITSKLLSK